MSRIENVKGRLGYDHLVPLNQKAIGEIAEARRRIEGDRQSKGYKANQRRLRQQQFIENLPRMQFKRALGHMVDGTATPEDIGYVLGHADRFGRQVDKVTILNFSRNGKI